MCFSFCFVSFRLVRSGAGQYLHAQRGVSREPAHGAAGGQWARPAPANAASDSQPLPLSTYCGSICVPETPRHFCMRCSPHGPLPRWSSAIALKAPAVPGRPSEPSDTCSPPVWTVKPAETSLAPWWTPREPPQPNAGREGAKAAAQGPAGRSHSESPLAGKKKKNNPKQYFGSPNYELPSSLIENYYGDRPDFTPPL